MWSSRNRFADSVELAGHSDCVRQAHIVADVLITIGDDGFIVFWSVQHILQRIRNNRAKLDIPCRKVRAHLAPIAASDILSTSLLVTAGGDNRVRVWPIEAFSSRGPHPSHRIGYWELRQTHVPSACIIASPQSATGPAAPMGQHGVAFGKRTTQDQGGVLCVGTAAGVVSAWTLYQEAPEAQHHPGPPTSMVHTLTAGLNTNAPAQCLDSSDSPVTSLWSSEPPEQWGAVVTLALAYDGLGVWSGHDGGTVALRSTLNGYLLATLNGYGAGVRSIQCLTLPPTAQIAIHSRSSKSPLKLAPSIGARSRPLCPPNGLSTPNSSNQSPSGAIARTVSRNWIQAQQRIADGTPFGELCASFLQPSAFSPCASPLTAFTPNEAATSPLPNGPLRQSKNQRTRVRTAAALLLKERLAEGEGLEDAVRGVGGDVVVAVGTTAACITMWRAGSGQHQRKVLEHSPALESRGLPFTACLDVPLHTGAIT